MNYSTKKHLAAFYFYPFYLILKKIEKIQYVWKFYH